MRTLWLEDSKLKMVDQTLLPHEKKIIELSTVEQVAASIKTMQVRGAPAIGVAGAYGMAIAKLTGCDLKKAAALLTSTRPTAYNLFYAVDRCLKSKDPVKEAAQINTEELGRCKKIGEVGSKLINDGCKILTHCNAGALACPDYGTALAPVYHAHASGKKVHVYADETRPRLQGAKLTCFELKEHGVPFTLITDNMAAYLMKTQKIDLAIVGADRITANGDFANKIGTYSLAINASYHKVPFYVAAPFSTIDFSLTSGDQIKIEERPPDEVRIINGKPISVECNAWNPSFDVTPAKLAAGIITEKGIFKPSGLPQE
ncbi:MAG: S-methyl-5-thioribose-1-phosphate isomerase [archaeon]